MSFESVYALIPSQHSEASKSAIHRSKYPADTPPTASTFGAACTAQVRITNLGGSYDDSSQAHRHRQSGATFGPKNLHYSDVTAYQKKHTLPEMPAPKRFQYSDRRKPAVVKKSQLIDSSSSENLSPKKKQKNFITENALAVIMADARKPSATGINYLKKSDYGEVPSYLSSVKSELDAEKYYIREVLQREAEEQKKKEPRYTFLPELEREKLLFLLKKKWESINAEYQQITHIVALDTIGKVRRKEKFEEELAFLEKAIEKLSKKFVFVREEANQ